MALIDLHIHSVYSCDGEFNPEALVSFAQKAGLHAIALTDHNTCAGVHETVELGKKANITVIPAIELDCFFNDVLFHVLGYGIDPDNPLIQKVDSDVLKMNRESSLETIRLINKAGLELEKDEAIAKAKNGYVTGELAAEILLNKPNAGANPLLLPYLPGGERSNNPYVNFYWDFCGQGKPAYVHIPYISMKEAIEIIKNSGGLAVLAHPGQNLKNREFLLPSIIRLGIEGIEAYSSYHSREICDYYKQKAEEARLLISGGSDFHGKTKPSIRMGQFGLERDGDDLVEALLSIIAH
jgi:predicted metal-dependent phosphoesterase TrpH